MGGKRAGALGISRALRGGMRNHVVALFVVLVSTALANTASAQSTREPVVVMRADTPSVAPHLATDGDLALRAPDPGEYVLPIIGTIIGGAATVGGAIFTLGSLFTLALHDSTPTNADVWLAGSAAVLAVGAVCLGFSIAELVHLHRRANEAEAAVRVMTTPGGALVRVEGRF